MKHTIKMIVTDLDGTLLRSDSSISEYTKAVFKRCQDFGIKIAYATGRGGGIEHVAPASLFDATVTSNGVTAQIGSELVYNRPIPYLAARPILIACGERALKCGAHTSDMHYAAFPLSDIWPSFKNFEVVDFSTFEHDVQKIWVYNATADDIAFINSQLSDELYMVMAMDSYAMIMHKDATKAKATAELASVWGIAAHEIAAFGDDLNDVDMLSYAGVAVAMGNALPEVKAVSDHICLSNDEDGLAKWLEEHIL